MGKPDFFSSKFIVYLNGDIKEVNINLLKNRLKAACGFRDENARKEAYNKLFSQNANISEIVIKDDFQSEEERYKNNYYDGPLVKKGIVFKAKEYRYEGEILNDQMSGKGKIVYHNYEKDNDDGNVYEGNFYNDKPNGNGKYKYNEGVFKGAELEGNFENGLEGKGFLSCPDGSYYTGEFKGGVPDGIGSATSPDGIKYEGEFKKGGITGQGTETRANGAKYVGEFLNGQKHGQGVEILDDGRKYEGGFKNGNFDGKGVLSFPDGDKFVGEYKDGKPDGPGVDIYANGDMYEGEYKNGKRHGQVVVTRTNGDKCKYTYVNGVRQGKAEAQITENGMKIIYELNFKNDDLEKNGKIKYPNGNVYEGEIDLKTWKPVPGKGGFILNNGKWIGKLNNNLPNGYGEFHYDNGDIYIGEMKEGKRVGNGSIKYSDGSMAQGNFVNDELNGEGVYLGVVKDVNGQKVRLQYKGNFVNGKYEGKGEFIDEEGEKYIGEFKNGLKSGHGVLTTINGDKHAGNFKNDVEEGKFVVLRKNGNIEKGLYKDGYRQGEWNVDYFYGDKGKYTYKNGERQGKAEVHRKIDGMECIYELNYKDGFIEKNGKIKYPNGNVYNGEIDLKTWKPVPNKECELIINGVDTWKGEIKNGLPYRKGVMFYENGGKYEGEYKNGKMHGIGVLMFPNGDKYAGNFLEGKREGRGVYTFADGTKYEGEYKNGKRHGQGVLTFPNGDKYAGNFLEGKEDGRGVYTFADGVKYEGEYKNGKRHGQGVLTFTNGDKGKFTYVNGVKQGKAEVQRTMNGMKSIYEFNFQNNVLENNAKIAYPNGNVYEGEIDLKTWKPVPNKEQEFIKNGGRQEKEPINYNKLDMEIKGKRNNNSRNIKKITGDDLRKKSYEVKARARVNH